MERDAKVSEKNISSSKVDQSRKRKHEESESTDCKSQSATRSELVQVKLDTQLEEDSSNCAGSESSTIVIISSESVTSSTERTGNESPVADSGNEEDIPDNTSCWTELGCFSKLRVAVAPNIYQPKDIFYSFIYSIDKFGFSESLMRRAASEEQKMKLGRIKEALTEFVDLNYEEVTQIPMEKLQKLYLKIDNSIKEKNERLGRIILQTGSAIIQDELLMRLETFKPIREFICQLIYMVRMILRDSGKDKYRVPKAMFQELFVRFIKIFQLEVFCGNNMVDYTLVIGEKTVVSRPDGLICHRFRDTKAVLAVVEVKGECSECDDEATERTLRSKEKKCNQAFHIDNKLRGQHVGDMLAALPDSLFEEKGIFGFTVQGTEVTLVSLTADENYLRHLKKGKFPAQSYKGASVMYSSKYNILTQAGREELVEMLFLMATIYDACDGNQ